MILCLKKLEILIKKFKKYNNKWMYIFYNIIKQKLNDVLNDIE